MGTDGPFFLVIEDDANVARSLRRLIGRYGSVRVASTVRTGLEAVEDRDDWSAVVVDAELPDGEGLRVLEALRAKNLAVAALVLTGHDDAAIANRAFALGAAYARKPVDAELVRSFIRMRLDGSRDRRRIVVSTWAERYGLTESETALLALSVEGTSREALAAARGTTPRTIDTHVNHLLKKTRDESLVAAVVRLLREAMR